jgi:hypothetical protein
MKEYKLLVDSPDLPKGSIAIQADDGLYDVIYPDGGIIPLKPQQIENRPEVWGLVEEKGEEKSDYKPHPYRPFLPGHEKEFYYVAENGRVLKTTMSFSSPYMYGLVFTGVFPTKEGAKMEALRREARAKCWFPNKGDVCYAYDMEMEEVVEYPYSGDDIDAKYVSMGNVHRTAEGALEWKEKYLEAFTCLL